MAAYTAIPGEDERPSQSLDHATSSLIREEVRALMRQELQAMRAAPAPAPATEELDGNPPSYDSAAADTSRPAPEEMRSEAARLLSENEPPTDTQPKEPHWFARGFQSLPTGIRFMIIFAPFAAVFVLMPIFCLHGDVLQVTVTAFLMVLANPFIFAIACVSTLVSANAPKHNLISPSSSSALLSAASTRARTAETRQRRAARTRRAPC
jgi:hypothetical protein